MSVTMRSTSADGDSMDHFLVVSVTMRSAEAGGGGGCMYACMWQWWLYLKGGG